MEDKVLRYFQLLEKLKQSKGYIISKKINLFSLSTYIFTENYNQLINQIELQTNPKGSQEIHSVENREKLREVQIETLRFLHNFLASAQSLIDHTRVFVNDLYDDNELFKKEFIKKIELTFTNDEVSTFIRNFRQYLQHFKAPSISVVTNLLSKDRNYQRRVMISVSDLQQFSGWKSLAKEYISKHDKNIDLFLVSTTYFNKVNNFYKWFSEKQDSLHKSEFKEMENIKIEMTSANIKEIINDFIKNVNMSKEEFDLNITEVMTVMEKKAFLSFNQSSKFKYVLSICKKNKIQLDQKEILVLIKRYRTIK
ncbi:hypothetical protein [Halpernia frigidisoli]|uniref:Uncharacterized protein n=1 Tax=Halpernia frigidisoli TaxID=1125876 RepID=A0A1I3D9T2_9FLAO|nr:hypothetical protein [Halpernia frigidisoli]SFH83502.1 hypothetical protein SAMN05443292_0339 [Halpernia frigidisoli]